MSPAHPPRRSARSRAPLAAPRGSLCRTSHRGRRPRPLQQPDLGGVSRPRMCSALSRRRLCVRAAQRTRSARRPGSLARARGASSRLELPPPLAGSTDGAFSTVSLCSRRAPQARPRRSRLSGSAQRSAREARAACRASARAGGVVGAGRRALVVVCSVCREVRRARGTGRVVRWCRELSRICDALLAHGSCAACVCVRVRRWRRRRVVRSCDRGALIWPFRCFETGVPKPLVWRHA